MAELSTTSYTIYKIYTYITAAWSMNMIWISIMVSNLSSTCFLHQVPFIVFLLFCLQVIAHIRFSFSPGEIHSLCVHTDQYCFHLFLRHETWECLYIFNLSALKTFIPFVSLLNSKENTQKLRSWDYVFPENYPFHHLAFLSIKNTTTFIPVVSCSNHVFPMIQLQFPQYTAYSILGLQFGFWIVTAIIAFGCNEIHLIVTSNRCSYRAPNSINTHIHVTLYIFSSFVPFYIHTFFFMAR